MTRVAASIVSLVVLAALVLEGCGESQCLCDEPPDGGAGQDGGERLDAAAVDGEQVFEQLPTAMPSPARAAMR